MPAFVAWLVRLVPWILGNVIGDSVLKWAAQKAFTFALATVVLPVVLNNFIYDLMKMAFSIIGDQKVDGMDGTITFTGLAAHLCTQLRLSDCLACIAAALIVRFTLACIPFVRL